MTPDPETDPFNPDATEAKPEGEPSDDLAALRSKAAERDDYLDRLKRTMAEFQNFKARVAKEKADLRRFATADAVRAVLPVLDNLERATAAANHEEQDPLLDGVRMVLDQFAKALDQLGVRAVVTDGARFDPAQMEAVARIKTNQATENTVVEVFEKGYRLDDLVIRHARVAVATLEKPES